MKMSEDEYIDLRLDGQIEWYDKKSLDAQWIEYRSTCESLKHEKFLFLSGAEPYCEENSYHLLVQRVEGLISKENSEWFRYTKKPSKKSNSDLDAKK